MRPDRRRQRRLQTLNIYREKRLLTWVNQSRHTVRSSGESMASLCQTLPVQSGFFLSVCCASKQWRFFCCIGARCSRTDSVCGVFPLRSSNCTPPSSSSSLSSSPSVLSSASVRNAARTGPAVIQRKQAGLRRPCRGLETSRRSVSVSGDEAAAAAARRRPALRSGGCTETRVLPLILIIIIFIFFRSITTCTFWEPASL